jgi:hypothetical protein
VVVDFFEKMLNLGLANKDQNVRGLKVPEIVPKVKVSEMTSIMRGE